MDTIHGLNGRLRSAAHDLAHEHRQRRHGRIQPFAVLEQQRLGRLKQLLTRQHVEKFHRLGRSHPASHVAVTLMQGALGITINGADLCKDGMGAS